MKTYIKYFLIIIIFIISSYVIYAQKQQYLEKNHTPINMQYNDSSFVLLSNSIDKYSVFLTGEAHDQKWNAEIEMQTLKYLYRNAGVRIFVCEYPHSFQFLLNKYLSTGDTLYLETLISHLDDSGNIGSLFKELNEFNKTLPDSEKIVIKAIDYEENSQASYLGLYNLFPIVDNTLKAPLQISKGIKGIIHLANTRVTPSNKRQKKFISFLLKDIEVGEKYYKYFLKDNFYDFKMIAEGIRIGLDSPTKKSTTKKDSIFWLDREAFMYNAFVDIINNNSGAKFYGHFGITHTLLKPVYKELDEREFRIPIAAMLNSNVESSVKNKICSIGIEYAKPRYVKLNFVDKDSAKYQSSRTTILPKQDKPLFAMFSKTDLTLFKLDAEGTPFKDVAESFQYVIFNKNE